MNSYVLTIIKHVATYIINKPLYPYQAAAANVILSSIDNNLGSIIIMLPRQSSESRLNAISGRFGVHTLAAILDQLCTD